MDHVKAKAEIRKRAADSANIFLIAHAQDQATDRKVDRLDIKRCLLCGHITEGPVRDLKSGQWRCRVECTVGGDPVAVAVEIPEGTKEKPASHLEVVTVFKIKVKK